jgi:hypothetical protein
VIVTHIHGETVETEGPGPLEVACWFLTSHFATNCDTW